MKPAEAVLNNGLEAGPVQVVEIAGDTYYRIDHFDAMPPFFMTVVSGAEHWMFVSSSGGLTSGRRDPDNALFPYTTDDKIHDAWATTGPRTCLRVEDGERGRLWQPFAREPSTYRLQRRLYKSLEGNKLVFEEVNHDLELRFAYRWSTGERLGFIRRAELENTGSRRRRVAVLDGLRNLLPWGVNRTLQNEMSTLVDAYKQAEAVPGLPMALYSLSSIPTDRAEPSEALRATVAWSSGLDAPGLLLSEDQVRGFCEGRALRAEPVSRGKRGAFFVFDQLELAPGATRAWYLAADVAQGPGDVPELMQSLAAGLPADTIEADIEAGTRRLRKLVGSADGFQASSDPLVAGRHFSNTLFNIMRGGVFDRSYDLPVADLLRFVGEWHAPLRERWGRVLEGRGSSIALPEVMALADKEGDPDLTRLLLEYLPLTFSRRHGDPSRPWNHFFIGVRNADGTHCLSYQGNWRDIFQNWEALAWSYPGYAGHFIAKFVNASTADGYNPYRISRSGFDWEVLDPSDPWSNIGYWGDHQVGYLQRLLDLSQRQQPGQLQQLLSAAVFVYADVPYRLRNYEEQLRDPRNTVVYDQARANRIAERVERLGADGKLAIQADGDIVRVTLLEKLLVPALAKLGSLVPGGGIWMNTQRPEWNDANNALVGYGLSVVTLCTLRSYLCQLEKLLDGAGGQRFSLTVETADAFAGLDRVLRQHRGQLEGAFDGAGRRAFMDAAGCAMDAWRHAIYAGFSGRRRALELRDILQFIRLARAWIDHGIALNERPDGLFHAYNLLRPAGAAVEIERLDVMLEGQVAVLNSGYLEPGQSLSLLGRLRQSELYRADQNSYLLYPNRELPAFLDKNRLSPELLAGNEWARRSLDAGPNPYLVRDVRGDVHFAGRFRHAAELAAELRQDPTVGPEDAAWLLEAYEQVFHHQRFTGRSGSMYKYEGLGCIYWHMVSKLALAVAEIALDARLAGAPDQVVQGLAERYRDIRAGLGLHKSPGQYGAFPTDPYSHTPGFSGVQQPGLTGQVKEDVIARLRELGIAVDQGQVTFAPLLLARSEFLDQPYLWSYSSQGEFRSEPLPAGSLAFCLCGVPVIYRLAQAACVTVVEPQGEEHRLPGNSLGREWSRSLFWRDGRIGKIQVDVPRAELA